jgi:hypothetical protein
MTGTIGLETFQDTRDEAPLKVPQPHWVHDSTTCAAEPQMGPEPMEGTATVSGRAAVVLEEALWLRQT